MPDLSFEMIIAFVLMVLGIVTIIRKRISIGIGRPRAIVDATLTGDRAILFGVVSFVVGLVPVVFIIYNLVTRNEANSKPETVSFIIGAGIAILFITFVFELFVEFLVALKDHSKK